MPLALALTVGCGADSDRVVPPYSLEAPVDHSTLANGMEVVVVPNHTSPIVTALTAIRAGSAVEDAASNGYSHLFEHMIFQGSEAVPGSAEFHDRLDALGVLSNGTTSVDRVTYFFTAETSALEPALELFAGAIRAPTLDATLLEKEKQVVLGEFDLNESDPSFALFQRAKSMLFGADALHIDPLGNRAVVTAATRDELVAMHATHYVPDNALLVLSGDVTPERGRELAETHFGSWSPGGGSAAPSPLGSNPANTYEVIAAPVSITSIELWWRGPSVEDDPVAAMAGQLLSTVTSQTDHFFRSLVRAGFSRGAGFGVAALHVAGYVRVSLTVPFGNEWSVISLLSAVMADLGRYGNVTEEQLERAREEALLNYLLLSTSPDVLPGAVANSWAVADADRFFSYVDALYDVDLEDLSRFAQDYLYLKPHAMALMSSPEVLDSERLTPPNLAIGYEL